MQGELNAERYLSANDDAGKYRLMIKARKAAVAKAVPPLQQPGAVVAQNRTEREHTELRMLSATVELG